MSTPHEPRVPDPLSAPLARALREYARTNRMPSDVRARVARRLARRRLPQLALACAIALAAAAAVLAWVVRPRPAALAEGPRAGEQASDRAAIEPAVISVSPAVSVSPAELPPRIDAHESRGESPAGGTTAAPVRNPRARVVPVVPAVEPVTIDRLAAERALVGDAWAALTDGDLARARARIEAHRRRFAAGVLVPEREAIAAIVRCHAEGPDPAVAEAFARAQPDSALQDRVRTACSEPQR